MDFAPVNYDEHALRNWANALKKTSKTANPAKLKATSKKSLEF